MQNNKQLTTLLININKELVLNNIEKYISYNKNSQNIKNTIFLYTINYDSNLNEVIKNVSQNVGLKAVYCLDDCISVLHLLNVSYNKLLIDQADYVCIYRGCLHILKLKNNKTPESGIAIIVDIYTIEKDLIETENKKRSIIFRNTLFNHKYNASIVLVLFFLCWLLYY